MESKAQSVISDFSKELERAGKCKSASRRYSKKLKNSVLELMNSGVARNDISKLSGLSMTTLANWRQARKKEKANEGTFKEIAVIQNVPDYSFCYTIETPSGTKIHLNNCREISSIVKAIESY